MKNSLDAKQCLEQIEIPSDHILVSFDVKSLFVCVPVDMAISCVKDALENHPNVWQEKTSLPKEAILTLLNICKDSNIFEWNNEIY